MATLLKPSAITRYLAQLTEQWQLLSQQAPSSSRLQAIRQTAWQAFAQQGFPSTRDERWKYTDLNHLANQQLLQNLSAVESTPLAITLPLLQIPAYRLVFVDGWFSAALSNHTDLPANIRWERLAAATLADHHLALLEQHCSDSLTALNAALWQDGLMIDIPANVQLDKLLQIIFISTKQAEQQAFHWRNIVSLGEQSRATVMINYYGTAEAAYWANHVTQIQLAEAATLEFCQYQQESQTAFHTAACYVEQAAQSQLIAHLFNQGGQLARQQMSVALQGKKAACHLYGLYLAHGRQHLDQLTEIDHQQAECASQQLYKGVLAERSRAVFNGKIIVQPDAQQTDAQQTNRNLLLSDDVEIDTRPQLEIYANDVRCTHGTAVGQLDEQALFYLRSRGLAPIEAKKLLIHGFAKEMLQYLQQPALQQLLLNDFKQQFGLEDEEMIHDA